jgi:hypothetical protein
VDRSTAALRKTGHFEDEVIVVGFAKSAIFSTPGEF